MVDEWVSATAAIAGKKDGPTNSGFSGIIGSSNMVINYKVLSDFDLHLQIIPQPLSILLLWMRRKDSHLLHWMRELYWLHRLLASSYLRYSKV